MHTKMEGGEYSFFVLLNLATTDLCRGCERGCNVFLYSCSWKARCASWIQAVHEKIPQFLKPKAHHFYPFLGFFGELGIQGCFKKKLGFVLRKTGEV